MTTTTALPRRIASTDPTVRDAINAIARDTGTSAVIASNAATCWSAKVSQVHKAAAGNHLFTHWHTGLWCRAANSLNVYHAAVKEAGGIVHWQGWTYEGIINQGAGVVANQGRSWTQASFKFGWASYPAQQSTPCIRVKGSNTSYYTSDKVCGVN